MFDSAGRNQKSGAGAEGDAGEQRGEPSLISKIEKL